MTKLFSDDAVRRALAEANDSLLAAGLVGVWLDTSGSGWTQAFVLTIAEADPVQVTVTPTGFDKDEHGTVVPVPRPPVLVTRLRPAAKEAVRAALADIEIGDHVEWDYRAPEPGRQQAGVVAWPLSTKIAELRQHIVSVEAEIARLEALAEPKD